MHALLNSIMKIIEFFNGFAENLIEPIGFLPEFAKEALIDSLNLIPFLFVIFILIEIIEQYYTKKRHLFVFFIKKSDLYLAVCLHQFRNAGFQLLQQPYTQGEY